MVLVKKWPFVFNFFFRHYRQGKCVFRYSRTKKHLPRLKKRKLETVKKLTFLHAFGPKMAIIRTFFLQAIQASKMSFTIFQNPKTPFYAIKTQSSKTLKIDFFPKGLTHAFGPKMAIFPTFFFQAIQARKMSFMIFQNEKTPFQAIKTRSSKSRKIDIFPKGLTHGFGPKKAIFASFFFQAIQGRNMSFTILQNQKTPFYAIKTQSSKSQKIDIFQKGITRGFGPKMAIFPTFFLGSIGEENVFYDILALKSTFLGYKNTKLKKSKN